MLNIWLHLRNHYLLGDQCSLSADRATLEKTHCDPA